MNSVPYSFQPLSDTPQQGADADPDGDSDPTNNSELTQIVLREIADLVLTSTGPTSVTAGTDLSYTLAVSNNGPTPAREVELSAPAPEGLVLVSADAPCASGFPCALGDLAAGATLNLNVSCHVPADYAGPDPIVATSAVAQAVFDPQPTDNVAVSATAVNRDASADLAVSLSAPTTAALGSTISYAVTVSNLGSDDAAGITLSGNVPTELSRYE